METRETVQIKEGSSSPERQNTGYLLRTADSTPISIEAPKGTENIRLKRTLEPKSIIKLTMPQGNTMFFETLAEPLNRSDRTKFPNSVWAQTLDIEESDYQTLSEKRKVYELYNLPTTRETSEKLGLGETIPEDIEEQLKKEIRQKQGMTSTPKKEISRESINRIAEGLGGNPPVPPTPKETKPPERKQEFKARAGKEIDSERLKKSLEKAKEAGWERPKKAKKAPEVSQPGPKQEPAVAKGGLNTLKRIERARELLKEGRYQEAEDIAKKMRRELKPEWARIPEESRGHIPPSQRPKKTYVEIQQENEQVQQRQQKKELEKKNFIERLLGL